MQHLYLTSECRLLAIIFWTHALAQSKYTAILHATHTCSHVNLEFFCGCGRMQTADECIIVLCDLDPLCFAFLSFLIPAVLAYQYSGQPELAIFIPVGSGQAIA